MWRKRLQYWQKGVGNRQAPQRRGEIHLRMVRSLMETGQIEQANASGRKALELNPTYPGAAFALNSHAWKLATSADPAHRDPAWRIEMAMKSVELQPQSASCWQVLGWADYQGW